MKILVLSDTHGNIEYAAEVIKNIGDRMSFIFHLGDCVSDANELMLRFPEKRFYFVRGNNDFGEAANDEELINICGRKILLLHGHRQSVHYNFLPLCLYAEEKGADTVFFGHTHMPVKSGYKNIMLFNPGSISLPRGFCGPTYGVADISEDGDIEFSVLERTAGNRYRRLTELGL